MKFSRKTILAVFAVLTAIVTFFKEQFGLAIDTTAVIGGLGAIVLYLLFEAKLDIKRIGAQAGRFKDPKFWIAFITAIIGVVGTSFNINFPMEVITSVLTLIMGFLFKKEFANT